MIEWVCQVKIWFCLNYQIKLGEEKYLSSVQTLNIDHEMGIIYFIQNEKSPILIYQTGNWYQDMHHLLSRIHSP